MSEAFGAILRFLGTILAEIHGVIPSYGIAIILLTILVRVVLIPLTVKQIRSMSAMQKIQPELKRIQQKYKGDRQKMNEELMKLYKEHGVNPLGGCFPLLMQAPVFIALYSVLRAAVIFDAGLPAPTPAQFAMDKTTICRPEGTPAPTGDGFTQVVCQRGSAEQTFDVALVKQVKIDNPRELDALPPYISRCTPRLDTSSDPDQVIGFTCQSPGGTGHLPKDSKLFADIVRDKSTFLGMHLACSPTQATSKTTIRQCTASDDASGGPALIGYFALVALMIGTTYYQQKQMSKQASGPQAKQMQMMGRIMPVFLGFISLSMPSGVIIYWVVSNIWTIGQQRFFLSRQPGATTAPPAASGGDKGKPPKQQKPKPKR